MTRMVAAVAVVALVALGGCGGGRHAKATVLRMASPDPAGVEHDPAVAYFVKRVARLSGGRLRIELDERWARGDPGDEAGLLRDVSHGAADLGWAHTRSFGAVGVHSFEALEAPLLVDGYGVEAAVVHSALPAGMLAGVRGAGLAGLAVLAGPLSRPIGTRSPLRSAADYRGLVFGARRSRVTDLAVRALGATPRSLSYQNVAPLYLDVLRHPGRPAALEDDLDTLFFERDARAQPPWVTANVGLWPRTTALIANPRRLDALSAVQRSWVQRAAADAARYSTVAADRDAQLVRELCASGVRFTTAPPRAIASLRRATRSVYASVEQRPATRRLVRRILALRRRAAPPTVPRLPSGCHGGRGPLPSTGGIRSPLRDGVYRVQITAADLRAADATDSPGTATLTLRRGRWRLEFTEPGRYVERGTYTGSALRTTFLTTWPVPDAQFFSIVGDGDGLRFHVVHAGDLAFSRATYASHRWPRIGD
jgi:TRAP-type transport system periplasmic protein